MNRFSQIGCITTRAEIQAALQSQRLQPQRRPRDTHLLREEVYTHLREDNELEKTVTRHSRDLQAISSPESRESESAPLLNIHALL